MTVHTSAEPRRAVLGKPERRGLLGLDLPETVFGLGVAGAGALLCLLSGGSPLGFAVLLLAIAVSSVALFLPYKCRTPFRQVPVDVRYWRARRSDRTTYRSGAREAGVELDTGRQVDVAPPPEVGALRWLAVPLEGGELAAQVHPDGSVTGCLEIAGPGIGLFDLDDHEAAWDRWSTALADTANSSTLVDRLSALELCRPGDPRGHDAYLDERHDGSVPRQLVESYNELHATVGTVTDSHRNYIAFRIAGGMTFSRAVRLAGGGDGGIGALVAREAVALSDRLKAAQITVVRPVDVRRASALVRALYDPAHPIDEWAHESPRTAWPMLARDEPSYLQVNGGWCTAVGWVKRWPMRGGAVNFLAPLLVQTPGLVRTVAVTFALVPTDKAMSEALGDLTVDEAESRRKARGGKVDDPRDRRQQTQAGIRAEDVADGASGVRVVGYVAVSGAGPELLAEDKGRVLRSAARSDVVLEWCDKEHGRFLPAVLPFCRGVA